MDDAFLDPRIRLRRRATATVLLMMLTAAGVVYGQQPIPLISVDVDLSDFGIDGPASVVRGRVSIAYAPDGPRLAMYYLRDTLPPRRISSNWER